MSEFSVLTNISAGVGALIAVYAILAVLILLGVYALIRIAVLAKRMRRKPKYDDQDCANCDKLREKDEQIIRLEDRIRELESKLHEISSKEEVVSVTSAEVAPVAETAAKETPMEEVTSAETAPVVIPVVVATEERTLSESIALAAASGEKGLISKKSIIAYLSEKYGEAVELNGRENRTPNGKLLLSDNHFAFTPAGKRVCFTYVYETDAGTVVSLIKLDEPFVAAILPDHADIRRSAFPKNKAKDWYSVVADSTFTEASYYAVLDHAIELIRGAEAPVAEPIVEEEVPEVSLSESLAAAKETGAVGVVTKKSIIDHLAATFGDKVELNGRANRTPNGKLLMSDNHFAFAPDGKRVCFTYIYEDDDGRITILLRTTSDHAKDIRAAHNTTGKKSAFPKNKEKDWYSVVVDETFTEKGVYDELDRAALNIIGAEVAATIPKPEPEVSLSESLAAAKETGAVGVVTKKSIIDHLAATFGEKVELNGRANRTPNGKLLMSDNHFAFAPDGKRVCFTYIYEDDDGRITILLRTTADHAKAIRAEHKATGAKSAFPKNKERDWYSVVVDDTFTESGVYAELDRAALNIIGTEIAATIPEPEPEPEVSLSESLAAAKETGAVGVVTKKSIIDHLAATFGEKVELNGRANRTPNGKLLMSDNHFAFAPDGKRVCFTYIYEDDDGRITILLRTTAAHAKDIRANHKATGAKSAFPKNKERDWYSVVVDETFTEKGVYDELDRAALNIIGAEIAATIPEPEPAPVIEEVAPVVEEPAPAVEEPAPVSEGKSLKESLAAAKAIGAVGVVTKKSIFNHLAATFGDKVELNGRANKTPNGKLLMSDNHFAFAADGRRVCFTYIYEDDDGRVTILLRTNEEHAKIIHAVHPATGTKSAFPKNKERDWYSVVVDDTFTEKGVYAELDRAALNIINAEPLPVAEEPVAEEVSLKESLAAAKAVGAVGVVTKKSVIDYLTGKYGDKVEINARENRTPNGKLLLSDNHFALADGKRVCFTYLYEDEGRIVALLRFSAAQAEALHAAHNATAVKSAFPKNKDKDWYSVIVDDTFTEQDVYAAIDESISYVLSK